MTPASEKQPVTNTRALVAFTAGGARYAALVEEVAGMIEAERISPLPGRPAPVAGVVAFRGGVVPVLDLAAALGGEPTTNTIDAYAVVLERGTDRFALLVRGMPRLVPAREATVARVAATDAPPTEGVSAGPAVLAHYDIDGREVVGLDFWSLMDSFAPPAAFRLSGVGGR